MFSLRHIPNVDNLKTFVYYRTETRALIEKLNQISLIIVQFMYGMWIPRDVDPDVVKIPVMGLWTLRTFSSGTPSKDAHWGFKNFE